MLTDFYAFIVNEGQISRPESRISCGAAPAEIGEYVIDAFRRTNEVLRVPRASWTPV